MNIWEQETEKLKNKIMEERQRYMFQFGSEPNYVVIPIHYASLLETDNYYSIGCSYDTYYGMQVIESINCHFINEIKVY